MFLKLTSCLINTKTINKIVFHTEKYSLYIKEPRTSGFLMAGSGNVSIKDEYILHVTKEHSHVDYERVGKFIKQFELK
jgi:hypothetical protein